MSTLPALFTLILATLRAAIAPAAARNRARTALLVLVWTRLSRMALRFERLYARWRAGTIRAPRPAAPRTRAPHPNLPTRPAWLIAECREAAAIASQLQHLLATPDAAEFLAACPHATRLLRPLATMLGLTFPTDPARPAPQPAPHPPAPPQLPPTPSPPRPVRRLFSPFPRII